MKTREKEPITQFERFLNIILSPNALNFTNKVKAFLVAGEIDDGGQIVEINFVWNLNLSMYNLSNKMCRKAFCQKKTFLTI